MRGGRFFVFIVSLFLSLASDFHAEMILEYDYIFGFEVEEIQKDDDMFLKMSGLCGHSAYVFKEIQTVQKDNVLTVNIIVFFYHKKNSSGSFEEIVKIPDTVDTVLLGNDQVEVWKRQ